MTKQKKRMLVIGIANDKSIASSIVAHAKKMGYEIIGSTVPDPKMMARAQKAVGPDVLLLPCDVSKPEDIAALAKAVRKKWKSGFDYLVHAVAFSDKNELTGSILDTSMENFIRTMVISSLSLILLTKAFAPQLRAGGCISAMTFKASRDRSKNYNVMAMAKAALETAITYIAFDPLIGLRGIRCIGVSAGPIPTLSSRGVEGFPLSEKIGKLRTVSGRNVTVDEFGAAVVTLMTIVGLTAVTIDVDNGLSKIGMGAGDLEYELYGKYVDQFLAERPLPIAA